MNRDDIIAMAREAGFSNAVGKHIGLDDDLERFAALVAVAEREACAKVCDDWPNGRDDVYSIGEAIRSRGEK